jgi:Protein of unknown function (DUF2865)
MKPASGLERGLNMFVPSILSLLKQKCSLLALGVLAFALANFSILTPANADEWSCRALEIQINAAPRSQPSGRNSAQAERFAKAISAQNVQINKAQSQIRALGCSGSIITLGGGSKPSCSRLTTALKSMNANMSKLKAQYARLSKGGGTVSSRDVLKARYNSMGCGQENRQRVITVKADQKPKSNIAAILGDTKAKREDRNREARNREERSRNERKRQAESLAIPGLSFSGDTFRTLCVRKCDGYYFPISFSTTKENFKRDIVACESMCPGTEVELFMHKVPEEESEDMVSQKGEPYKAMSYAFAYRRDGVSADPACRCQAIQGMAILNTGEAASSGIASIDGKTVNEPDAFETPDTVPVPMPRLEARADILFDRETVADAAGDLTDDDIIAVFEPQLAETNADGSLRIVGPVFLPDPSGAINLKVPLRPLLR